MIAPHENQREGWKHDTKKIFLKFFIEISKYAEIENFVKNQYSDKKLK